MDGVNASRVDVSKPTIMVTTTGVTESTALDMPLEDESYRRYQLAEREMLEVLEDNDMDDATRKRRMMRVFDRFRYEYTQLSTLLREHVRTQRRIMDKCIEMKNELVHAALKIKTNQHVQDEEMKNLLFYRNECEIAWKERRVSEERERDAMRIIEDLKSEIEELQNQVKALVATALPPSAGASERVAGKLGSALTDSISAGALGSPSKTVAALKKHAGVGRGSALNQSMAISRSAAPTGLSFEDWKLATRVWDPRAAPVPPRSPTPSLETLLALEKSQEIARCVSVPSLQPSAMERAAAATAMLPLTPSPTRKSRKPHTAVGFLRATTPASSATTAATTLSPTKRTIAPLPHV